MLNILAVDDDESILKLVKHYLGSWGHSVKTETSPLKALETSFRQKIDLLVSDINMPDMSGFEFIEKFREKPFMGSVPVVMLTGVSELDEVKSALSLGAMDYIIKPLDKEVGVAKIKKLVDRISASEIQIPRSSKNSIVSVNMPATLTSIGEDFAKVILPHKVSVGEKLNLFGEIFHQLDLRDISLTVESCEKVEEGFATFLRFPSLDGLAKQTIRDWMNKFR